MNGDFILALVWFGVAAVGVACLMIWFAEKCAQALGWC